MPKINNAGVPSYEGHEGVVTNAVGEQFEVNASRDLEGNRPEGYVDEPVGDGPEERDVVTGDIRPVDDGEPDDDANGEKETRRNDTDSLDVRDKGQGDGDGNAKNASPAAGSARKATPPSAAKRSGGTENK